MRADLQAANTVVQEMEIDLVTIIGLFKIAIFIIFWTKTVTFVWWKQIFHTSKVSIFKNTTRDPLDIYTEANYDNSK